MAKKDYTDEFRQSAIEMVITERNTTISVAKRLGINYHTLREWVQAAKSNTADEPHPQGRSHRAACPRA